MSRILIVEDEESVRHLLREVLERAGYEVVEARNGWEGVQRYQATPIDLVITDMQMPVMDGMHMILELRRMCPLARILAISGEQQGLDMACALNVQYTLKKPFVLATLLTTVRKLVLSHADTR